MTSSVKRVMRVGIATVIGAAVSLAGVLPAHAVTVDQGTLATIRAHLVDAGVSTTTADALVAKYASGKVWDSMNGSAKPVATAVKSVGDYRETVSTFRDGSIRTASIEQPAASSGGATAYKVSNCRVSSSGSTKTYTGCWVSESTIVISAGFSVKYQTSPGAAKVLQTGPESITILALGAGANNVKRSIPYANASASTPAIARLTFVPTGMTFATTCRLELQVTRSGNATAQAWF